MKPSRLQLDNYYVTDLSVTANPKHDPGEKSELNTSDIKVDAQPIAPQEGQPHWHVQLRVSYSPGSDSNSPYAFSIGLLGVFEVIEAQDAEKDAALVNTNATSVLYSTARVILRNAMAQGPFPPLLLPTVSFYDPKSKEVMTQKKG